MTYNPEAEIDRILKESGAVLLRHRKHQIWQMPDGKKFVQSSTPSDVKAARNNLSVLRRMVGKEDRSVGVAKKKEAAIQPYVEPVAKEAIPGAVQHSITAPQDGLYATKVCSSCGDEKSIHDFRRNRHCRIGVCNDCMFVRQSDGIKRHYARKRAAEERKQRAEKRNAEKVAQLHEAFVASMVEPRRHGILRRIWNWITQEPA